MGISVWVAVGGYTTRIVPVLVAGDDSPAAIAIGDSSDSGTIAAVAVARGTGGTVAIIGIGTACGLVAAAVIVATGP